LIRKYFSEYTNTRTQIIHTDLHEENIIVTPTGNLILVDVDGLQEGHTSQDIAGYLIPTHKLLDLNEIDDTIQYDKFLSGYESEFKLTKNEVKIIPLWMLVRLLTNFEYIINEIKEIPPSDTRKKIVKCSLILEYIRGIILRF
jgi:Ser/Thr protein kinase RdoA (MazF antagonist)